MIVSRQFAPAALVTAEQRVGVRADDEFIAGIVAAGGEDRGMHRGEDFAFVGPGRGRIERGAIGEIG
jgi:hypothetical protein